MTACFKFILMGELFFALCAPVSAHDGPPFRIMTNQRIGPWIVSVWTHANVGTSPIWVQVFSTSGRQVPDDLRVEVAVQPVKKNQPERRYVFVREKQRVNCQYVGDVTLDFQGLWHITVFLQSPLGAGESTATVQATTHGFGRWDLLIYLLPFLAFGLLGGISLLRRRGYRLLSLPTRS